ncbi:hypothetical protein [Saccharothrix luteola]|uniref:hypothetical protein n=1 Tax=Saccharothrix luteola TaxID=2893018 RepID=UPI001E60A2DE|nr:hypothetical protein [Saccharothrix luteola]MCC8244981.1 hypothetical protein [Saccharothrix luteola]
MTSNPPPRRRCTDPLAATLSAGLIGALIIDGRLLQELLIITVVVTLFLLAYVITVPTDQPFRRLQALLHLVLNQNIGPDGLPAPWHQPDLPVHRSLYRNRALIDASARTGWHAVHRTMVIVDVQGFCAPDRTLPHQLGTREGLYAALVEALAAAGVPWDACYHEDRGDGVLVLVPPEYPKAPLVEVLPKALARAVRSRNDISHDAAQTRLRLTLHAGEVAFDTYGVTSTQLTTAFRLLEAAPLKEALTSSPGVVAMIVSRVVFDDVIRHSPVLAGATFRPVEVEVKEVRDTAWIALPDHPYTVDPTVLERRP